MKKSYAILSCIAAVLLLCSCSVKSTEEYYSSSAVSKTAGQVSVKINCETALNQLPAELKNGDYIPEDGILYDGTVEIQEGDTAFSALVQAAKQEKLQLDYGGEGVSVYVKGIAHLYEFSCGELSGWMYKVNGIFQNAGCAAVVLQDGDTVEYLYTCDLGADIGNSYGEEK